MEEGTVKPHEELDKLFSSITRIISNFNKSAIIEDFFFQLFSGYVFANFISNFFRNLNDKMASKLKLDVRKIPIIQKEFADTKRDASNILDISVVKGIDQAYYDNFKKELKEKFPDFLCILFEVERILKINEIQDYLHKKQEDLKKFGKATDDYTIVVSTKTCELFI